LTPRRTKLAGWCLHYAIAAKPDAAIMIKFESEDAPSFEMLEDHAQILLSLMGHGSQAEGSISGESLETAVKELRIGLQQSDNETKAQASDKDDFDDEQDSDSVPLSTRAKPLEQMLEHAIRRETYLIWRPS